MFKVVSESIGLGDSGFLGIQKKRGQVLLKLTDIQHVFKVDGEDKAEIVMFSGDRFIAKIEDLNELLQAIDRIKK